MKENWKSVLVAVLKFLLTLLAGAAGGAALTMAP